jgi:hypothetical protein
MARFSDFMVHLTRTEISTPDRTRRRPFLKTGPEEVSPFIVARVAGLTNLFGIPVFIPTTNDSTIFFGPFDDTAIGQVAAFAVDMVHVFGIKSIFDGIGIIHGVIEVNGLTIIVGYFNIGAATLPDGNFDV